MSGTPDVVRDVARFVREYVPREGIAPLLEDTMRLLKPDDSGALYLRALRLRMLERGYITPEQWPVEP